MRIVFTGGGTGGHFYPIIAVAEEIQKIVKERKIIQPELYFFAPAPFDERILFENNITFIQTPAGKMRRYFSVMNFLDIFKTFFGIVDTLFKLYSVYPDVVVSKGGYGAVPTLMASRILGIPVILHDSDATPGRATLLAAPFAKKIALSYNDALEHLPEKVKEKTAVIGNPVREGVRNPARDGAHEFLELEKNIPTILILGGSTGSEKINDTVLTALPQLISKYQVVHQTGEKNFEVIRDTARVILEQNERRYRYKSFGFLSSLALKMAAGAADVVVSRAGSGSIFEIAAWGKASIIIPIPESVSRDQRVNAFAYAHAGATVVIEQGNLSPNILVAEIDRLFTNPKARTDMAEAAKKFAKPDAAHALATAVLDTALEHET
ncbi:MAG: UDP-N-acetylglucosamine--N-acetylmuramyl-(pentapeptide) pyrophosphoryl-undecaprenol N-acetylglucosamine transferase [Patescibacteria group bacterium]